MANGLAFGWQVENSSGVPVSGARIYTFRKGTTTPLPAYSDSAVTVPAANPIIADAAGWFAAYRQPTLDYTVVVKSADESITYDTRDYFAGDGTGSGGDAYLVVQTLAALEAVSGAVDNDTAQMLGRTTAGDGGGGLFRFDDGDQSTNVTNDPGQGIYIAPSSDATGASGAWVRVFDGIVDAAFYGFSESATAADNTTAINYCLSYLRTVVNGINTDEAPVAMKTGPGQFNVTSVNATRIRARAWRWDAYGTQLNCATDMAVVVDLTHSRGFSIRNLVVKGDETTPPLRGFQTGYMDDATSSGEFVLDNCRTYGKFEQCGWYNGGSEEIATIACGWRNTNSASTSYAYIADGFNWWGKYSAYLTPANGDHMVAAVTSVSAAATATVTTAIAHGLTTGEFVRFFDVSGSSNVDGADSFWEVLSTPTPTTFTIGGTNGSAGTGGYVWRAQPVSHVNVEHIEMRAFKDNGGPAVWMSSNCQRHRFRGYIYTLSGDAVVVYFRPTFFNFSPQGCEFDAAFEGAGLSNMFYLYEGETTTQTYNIGGWKIKDHGPQNDDPVFATNGANSVFNFIGIDVDIQSFAGSSRSLVDTQARYRMQGRISTRNATGITNVPEFYGDLIVNDPNNSAIPEGACRILAYALGGSDATFAVYKGQHRFYSGQPEVASSFASESFTRVGDGVVASQMFRTLAVTLADDTATSIDLPGNTPAAIISFASISNAFLNGTYWVRASASPQAIALTSGGVPATLSTGIKTGTTGTDAVFTISPHTDGNVYLENRSGASLSFTYTVMSAT